MADEVTVTVAFATVACWASRTVPTMRPDWTCDHAGTARATVKSSESLATLDPIRVVSCGPMRSSPEKVE